MASMRPGAQSRSIPKLLVPLIFPSALLGCLKTRREIGCRFQLTSRSMPQITSRPKGRLWRPRRLGSPKRLRRIRVEFGREGSRNMFSVHFLTHVIPLQFSTLGSQWFAMVILQTGVGKVGIRIRTLESFSIILDILFIFYVRWAMIRNIDIGFLSDSNNDNK